MKGIILINAYKYLPTKKALRSDYPSESYYFYLKKVVKELVLFK